MYFSNHITQKNRFMQRDCATRRAFLQLCYVPLQFFWLRCCICSFWLLKVRMVLLLLEMLLKRCSFSNTAKTSSLITRRPICKTNEVYSTCSKCGNLICNTLISDCPQTCQSGCFCKSGFARKGNVCVPAALELSCITGERVYCSKLSYLIKC